MNSIFGKFESSKSSSVPIEIGDIFSTSSSTVVVGGIGEGVDFGGGVGSGTIT